MITVTVLASAPYEVKIAAGLLRRIGKELLPLTGTPRPVMVITDDTVDSLYGGAARRTLSENGYSAHGYSFPPGETSKNLRTWEGMLNAMADCRLTRADRIIALGGGVVGDMAGFAASVYLRGIPYVQVPTTLLAMVDSSTGGKTGVNLPSGKNLAGAFHQPEAVLCDPDVLSTLPEARLLDGVAEAVKTALIGDAEMFGWFAAGAYAPRLTEIIARCVRIKAGLVTADEHDRGARQLLNLGHTLGHAIEKASAYQFSHGRAVAAGMAYAARLSTKLGICGEATFLRIRDTLAGCGLPVSAPYPPEELSAAVLSDKKRLGDTITFVLPKAIGECILYPVPTADLDQIIGLAAEPGRPLRRRAEEGRP